MRGVLTKKENAYKKPETAQNTSKQSLEPNKNKSGKCLGTNCKKVWNKSRPNPIKSIKIKVFGNTPEQTWTKSGTNPQKSGKRLWEIQNKPRGNVEQIQKNV